MPNAEPLPANDPVSRAIARQLATRRAQPVPLVATSYDIAIAGGLADVVARRTFRNAEEQSIEATLTFPMPVEAALYSLEARVAGRVLKGLAKARKAARETYEDAIDRGKTTVLHEELLKGIHMLSVGHVAPGAEIEVTVRFALPLAWIGGTVRLRIPTTVGDVYGSSGLPDSDELVQGGPRLLAALTVVSDIGTPRLAAGMLADGKAQVPLDRPISIAVDNWSARELTGRAADGRHVALSIAPAPVGEQPVDAAILIDRSGSMAEICGAGHDMTKHTAVLLGLSESSDELRDGDRLDLWQFDNAAEHVGDGGAASWRDLVRTLGGPQGGTEIGRSIAAVLDRRPLRDLVLVTDGKSYAIDVQALAARATRVTVVLIGEDSLEANVGHLAALTGGQLLAAEGTGIAAAVRSALRGLRGTGAVETATAGDRIVVVRSGMRIAASWSSTVIEDAGLAHRAAAAYAASLRLSSLAGKDASTLAEAEGLVTHLTSLVLVDEEGTAQEGLPATRKVALPTPATANAVCMKLAPGLGVDARMRAAPDASHVMHALCAPPPGMASGAGRGPLPRQASFSHGRSKSDFVEKNRPREPEIQDVDPRLLEVMDHADRIDWRGEAARLGKGDISGLPAPVIAAIARAAETRPIARLARRLGLSATSLVVALLAHSASGRDRHAERVYRALIGEPRREPVERLCERLRV